MMNSALGRLLPLILIALVGVVVWQNQQHQAAPPLRLACADISKGCPGQLAGRAVEVGMTGELQALKPIQVWLKAPGAKKVEARFTMEGMDMGFNLYTLRPDPQGVFRANVTLPVCVSGRRDWTMTLMVDGSELAVPFTTTM
jgi:hypothetical protein